MKTISKICLATGLATALVIGGCSGDSDGGSAGAPPPDRNVPGSAGATVAAFIAYLMTLDPNDETSEPLTINDSFAVPADETSDPQPIG